SPNLAGGLRDLLGLDESPFRCNASEGLEERAGVAGSGRADLEALDRRRPTLEARAARLQAIEVGVALATEPHAALPLAHGHDGRPTDPIVVAGPRVRVRAGAGERHQVTRPDVL